METFNGIENLGVDDEMFETYSDFNLVFPQTGLGIIIGCGGQILESGKQSFEDFGKSKLNNFQLKELKKRLDAAHKARGINVEVTEYMVQQLWGSFVARILFTILNYIYLAQFGRKYIVSRDKLDPNGYFSRFYIGKEIDTYLQSNPDIKRDLVLIFETAKKFLMSSSVFEQAKKRHKLYNREKGKDSPQSIFSRIISRKKREEHQNYSKNQRQISKIQDEIFDVMNLDLFNKLNDELQVKFKNSADLGEKLFNSF